MHLAVMAVTQAEKIELALVLGFGAILAVLVAWLFMRHLDKSDPCIRSRAKHVVLTAEEFLTSIRVDRPRSLKAHRDPAHPETAIVFSYERKTDGKCAIITHGPFQETDDSPARAAYARLAEAAYYGRPCDEICNWCGYCSFAYSPSCGTVSRPADILEPKV